MHTVIGDETFHEFEEELGGVNDIVQRKKGKGRNVTELQSQK